MKANRRSLALAALSVALAMHAPADPVTYWFGGVVTSVSNPSNAMPFGVNVGMPFTGRLSYDPSLVANSNVTTYPEGDIGFYYFTNVAGFSIFLQLAGHTITNINHPWRNAGLVGLYDQYNDEDSYWSDTSGRLTVDGVPYLTDPLFSIISIYLSDRSKTAFNSVAIPTNAPVLDNLRDSREFIWGAYIDDGGPTRVFSVSGVMTNVTLTEQVQLNHRSIAANTMQLGWPIALSDFTLESCTNLSTKNWQTVTNPVVDINVEHTVTASNNLPTRFYRLVK